MKALYPSLLFDKDMDLVVTNTLGMIRIAMLAGVKGNIENMTGQEITGENQRIQAEYLKKNVLPNIHDKTHEYTIKENINSIREMHDMFLENGMKKNIQWLELKIIRI